MFCGSEHTLSAATAADTLAKAKGLSTLTDACIRGMSQSTLPHTWNALQGQSTLIDS